MSAAHRRGDRGRLPLLLALLLVCGSAGFTARAQETATDEGAHDALYARRQLENARRLQDEHRLEAALRTTGRGLAVDAENAALHRMAAELLRALGRPDEAARHQAEADRIEPPPAPLPQRAHAPDGSGVVIALGAPDPLREGLATRLAVRLPGATLAPSPIETLTQARAALRDGAAASAVSIHVERARCGRNVKDGRFAVGVLRVASAGAGATPVLVGAHRASLSDPPPEATCQATVLSYALESALADPAVRRSLSDGAAGRVRPPEAWTRDALVALFPELPRGVARELAAGRGLLETGQLGRARAHFARALEIDPGNEEARAYFDEVDHSLRLSRELNAELGLDEREDIPGLDLAPRLSDPQRRALEQRITEERRQRDRLLAALAVLEDDAEAPDAETVAALSPAALPAADDPGRGFGVTMARRLAGTEDVEARVLFAPDGGPIARFYFARGAPVPVLREDDAGPGQPPERWIAFANGVRSDVWERGAPDSPDLHLVFSGDGRQLEQIALDTRHDGRPDRVFRYEEGRLVRESADTNGNGRFDRHEHFASDGTLALREEDVDHDGNTDLRTVFENDRVVRREILNPDLADTL